MGIAESTDSPVRLTTLAPRYSPKRSGLTVSASSAPSPRSNNTSAAMKNEPKVAVSMVRMTGPAARATGAGSTSSSSDHTAVMTRATAGMRYRRCTVSSSVRAEPRRLTAGRR
jgi:hypothetical protein